MAPDLVTVAIVAAHVELAWRDAFELLGREAEWPEGCCVETAEDLRDQLAAAGIDAVMVWGGFEIGYPDHSRWDDVLRHPVHAENALPRGQLGHAWVALEDGTIVDPTAGQYFVLASTALKIIPRDHVLWSRYHPVDLFPVGADARGADHD